MLGQPRRRPAAAGATILAVALLAGAPAAGLVTGAAGASTHRAKASAATQVKKSWEAFFSGKTPATKKIRLVQDGPAFARIIRAQSGSALARSTSARVSKVSLTSKTRAKVVYTVYLAGKPALKNTKGTSLYLQHRWKVSASSFCAILALEQTKPAVCAKAR